MTGNPKPRVIYDNIVSLKKIYCAYGCVNYNDHISYD